MYMYSYRNVHIHIHIHIHMHREEVKKTDWPRFLDVIIINTLFIEYMQRERERERERELNGTDRLAKRDRERERELNLQIDRRRGTELKIVRDYILRVSSCRLKCYFHPTRHAFKRKLSQNFTDFYPPLLSHAFSLHYHLQRQ